MGLPKWEFSTGKKHFTPGKKSGKMTLPPQKNMPVTALIGHSVAYCYLEFKLSYLKNLKLFLIRVKELFEPIDYSHIVLIIAIWPGDRIRRSEHSTVEHGSCDESV